MLSRIAILTVSDSGCSALTGARSWRRQLFAASQNTDFATEACERELMTFVTQVRQATRGGRRTAVNIHLFEMSRRFLVQNDATGKIYSLIYKGT